jgi:hypothetical protein
LLQFSGERTAVIDFNPEIEIPFSAIVSTQQGHDRIEVDGATLFLDAAASILDFFDAGRPLIDRRESLAVRRILDVAQSDRVYGALAPLESEIARPSAIPSPHWDRQRRADRRAVESTGRQQP